MALTIDALRRQRVRERVTVTAVAAMVVMAAATAHDVIVAREPVLLRLALHTIPLAAFGVLFVALRVPALEGRILLLTAFALAVMALASSVRLVLDPNHAVIHLMGVLIAIVAAGLFVPFPIRLGVVYHVSIWAAFIICTVTWWPQSGSMRLMVDNFHVAALTILSLLALRMRVTSDEREEALVRKLDDQTSQLTGEVREQKLGQERLLTLNRLTAVLNRLTERAASGIDAPTLYRTICTSFMQSEAFRAVAVVTLNEDGGSAEPQATEGMDLADVDALFARPFAGELLSELRAGQPAVCGDAWTGHSSDIAPRLSAIVTASRIPSEERCAAFPFQADRHVVGAMVFLPSAGDAFDLEELRLLHEVSKVVSSSLQRLLNEERSRRDREALHRSEERYRVLIENAREAVVVVQDYEMKYANPRASEMIGFTVEEILSKGVYGFIHPEELAALGPRLNRLLSSDRSMAEPMRVRLVRKDGSALHLDALAVRITWDGRPAVLGLAADVSDRVEAEAALKASEEFNRELVENLPIGVVHLDKEGTLVYENRAARRMFGAPEEGELASLGLGIDAVLASIPEEHRPSLEPLLAGRSAHGVIVPYRSIYGVELTMEVSAAPRFGPEGSITGFYLTIADVTQRESYQEEVRASEEKYRQVVENAKEAIVVAQDGELRFVNPRTCIMSGYTHDELIGKKFCDLIHPRDWDRVCSSHRQRVGGEDIPATYQFEAMRKDGSTFWVELTAVAIEWEGKPATLNFLSDVTERRQAIEALKDSMSRYEGLYHGVSIGLGRTRVVGGAVVECNAHMAAIFGYDDREQFKREFRMSEHYVDPDARPRLLETVARDGAARNYEAQMTRRDGTVIWVKFTEAIPADEESIDSVIEDITEERQAKDAQTHMLTALEQAGEAVLMTTPDGTITYANPAFETVTGYSVKEAMGRNIRVLESRETPPAHYEDLWRDLALGKAWNGTLISHKKDGSLYEQSTIVAPVRGRSGQHRAVCRGHARRHARAAHRGAAPAEPEDGGHRQARRRHRPRLQQPPYRHSRQHRDAPDGHPRGEPGAGADQRDRPQRGPRGGSDRATALLQPKDAHPAGPDEPQRHSAGYRAPAEETHRREHRTHHHRRRSRREHPSRPRPPAADPAQSGRQCPRCHAGRWQNHHRDAAGACR